MKNLYFKPKYGGGVNSCLSKNKFWFTLVELIIVVTIIAILATIAFITLGQYPGEARDVKRLADKNNIEKALEIYKAQKWDYPAFDTFEWNQVFWTWAWERVNSSLSTLPRDPVTKKPYKIEVITNQADKTKTAKVVLDWESKYINWSLANNTVSNNQNQGNQNNAIDKELENLKNQLQARITELEWVNKTWKSERSKNFFDTRLTEAKNLLNKNWLTKEEIKNKLKELEWLENKLVNNWQCDRNSYWRFTVDWNVIKDNQTGLLWSREVKNTKTFWFGAKKYCKDLRTDWKNTWRLPTFAEQWHIENYSCYKKTYEEFDDIIQEQGYWSSENYNGSDFYYFTHFIRDVQSYIKDWMDEFWWIFVICISDT